MANKLNSSVLLNVKVNHLRLGEAISFIEKKINEKEIKTSIFFLNSDCLYKAQNDKEYRNILNSSDLILADGIGLKMITWIFGGKMKDNCNGTDLSPVIMKMAAKAGSKIFLLGGKAGVAEKVAVNLRIKIPDIQITGSYHGYFSNDSEMIQNINNSGADILFVAMGVPAQEKWIFRNRKLLSPRLCLGVGALFDYLSGDIPRAPKFMRVIGLEWLWRIFIDPKRMIKRYVFDGARLFLIVYV